MGCGAAKDAKEGFEKEGEDGGQPKKDLFPGGKAFEVADDANYDDESDDDPMNIPAQGGVGMKENFGQGPVIGQGKQQQPLEEEGFPENEEPEAENNLDVMMIEGKEGDEVGFEPNEVKDGQDPMMMPSLKKVPPVMMSKKGVPSKKKLPKASAPKKAAKKKSSKGKVSKSKSSKKKSKSETKKSKKKPKAISFSKGGKSVSKKSKTVSSKKSSKKKSVSKSNSRKKSATEKKSSAGKKNKKSSSTTAKAKGAKMGKP